MHHLEKTRKQFTTILAVLGAVDLLLVIYLLLPDPVLLRERRRKPV